MIQSLQLVNFRNLKSGDIKFSPKINVFLGENGQGKSNLLEAIVVLCTGDSFRYAKNENLITFSQKESLIRAKFIENDLDYLIQCELLKSKKNISINSKRAVSSDLQQKFPIVVFSPESLAAIKEGGDLRRQLVDELLVTVNPKSSAILSEFKKALKTRNKILKNYCDGLVSRIETEALLESILPSYFDLAMNLTMLRIQAIQVISGDLNNSMKQISNNAVDISVEYVISDNKSLNLASEEIKNIMLGRLKQLHDAELTSGASLVGPHKHDIQFLYGGNDSRFYCSQGQQRALILSFKMAQIVYHKRIHGMYPILLLDDVLSELDAEKRSSLIQFLSEINTQIFITTTDLDLPSSLRSEDCAVLKVREGQIDS